VVALSQRFSVGIVLLRGRLVMKRILGPGNRVFDARLDPGTGVW
jgi:hypothetical protein